MRSALGILVFVLVVGVLGCESKTTSPEEGKQTAAATVDEAKDTSANKEEAKEKPSDSNKVEVAKEGSKFDPPVAIDTLPDGAFYCNMGKSHYARMEKGDNKCPLCGMALEHKGSAVKEDHGDHEGHEH